MPGPTAVRKASHIADAITKHRHSVRMKLGDQYRRERVACFRLDENVGPVSLEVQRTFGIVLKGHQAGIATAVTFVDRPFECFRDPGTVRWQEFLRAGDETTRRIIRLITALQNVIGKMTGCACISHDARRLPLLELPMIVFKYFRRETETVKPATVSLKIVV